MNPFKKRRIESEDKELRIEMEKIELEKAQKHYSPYVLTPDEIKGEEHDGESFKDVHPLEELKMRMQVTSQTKEKDTKAVPQTAEEEEVFTPSFNVNVNIFDNNEDTAEKLSHETKEEVEEEQFEQLQLSALEEVSGRYPEPERQDQDVSLFETCMPFITEGGKNELPESEPVYTLEKVESILGIEEEETPEPEEKIDETIIFESVKTADISDIDPDITPKEENEQEEISFTKTMPIVVTPDGLEESREIDISSEILKRQEQSKPLSDMPFKDDDDDFVAQTEYNGKADTKIIRRFLLTKRRNRFLALLLSILPLLILGIAKLAFLDSGMSESNNTLTVFSVICSGLAIIANIDSFKSVLSLFSKRAESSLLFVFSSLTCLTGIIFACVNNLAAEIIFCFSALICLNGFFRILFLFRKTVYIYRNFRLVSSPHKKFGMMLIDDAPTTFAMAHRAIEGDALILAPKETGFIKNFIKSSTVDKDLDGKVKILLSLAAALSALCGVAVGVYHSNALSGVIAACNIACVFSPFVLFGVNTMPLYAAAKRLSKYKAAVFGIKRAKKIEQANAVAIDCLDIFPQGSVKLHDLKILSPNNLEETIAVAAAITKTMKSPLFPIFKAAMDTNSQVQFPEADTIKYEERLGITGWVGDSRVFIGNRALMLAHGIEVGDMQTDKELLMQGYFPIYLARDGKACALLSVSYHPKESIAKELRKITAMGVTVLVNNCDQNLSEEMLCDYFDLYSDSVKVMSGSGVHMYKNATEKVSSFDCGAAVSGNADAIAGVVSCSIKIKRAVALLTVALILCIVIGFVLFAYKYFLTAKLFISASDLIIYQLTSFAITLIAYLFTKP